MNKDKISMTFDKNKKTYKTEAPWGDREDVTGDYAAIIANARTQLLFYKNDGREPSQKLLDDIRGYDEILKSKNPQSNGETFIKEKHKYATISENMRSLSNFEVVVLLKNQGKWK